ncbi:MAG TPA: GNAT family protein [Solirubrobacterales bacterium]|nr:GNAT family protein [Solirubrobacterales bacterium]
MAERLEISDAACLRPLRAADAPELHALIEGNRDRLARWLDWAAAQSFDDTVDFIRRAEAQLAANEGFQAALVEAGAIAGVVGHTGVDWRRRSTALGYWLDERHEGRGLMTLAVGALVDHSLRAWGLNRVEVRAAVGNRRSRAVVERLGFRHEGTLREAERVGERYLDSAVYGMLAEEWAGDP